MHTADSLEHPLVSIVLVNWNRSRDILDNIRSLRRQTWTNREVIVIDNGSKDGSVTALRKIEDIQLIELPENLGPARARNEGFRVAQGKYIPLLDSDSYLGRTSLEKLVTLMEKDSTLGIVGGRIMNWFTGDIDQWFYSHSYRLMGDSQFEAYSFSAAGALLRTQAVQAAGGFWNELFIYSEEVDLAIGVFRAGYRILYTPDVPFFHRASPEGRIPSANFFHYQIRNWIWILYRHYPFWPRVTRVSLLSAVYLVKSLRAGHLQSCVAGIVAGIRGTHWIQHFVPKLSPDQIRRLAALNRRWVIRRGGRPRKLPLVR